MKKIFFLKTCDTCKRIMKEFDFTGFDLHEIKSTVITAEELEEMKNLAGSYEALFSRRAQNYKKLGLKDQQLSEEDIKNYILSDYTFLKRPVVVDGDKIFVGNEKKNLEALGQHLK
ncbi:arsenate reductase family protein [Empedobacter sedimenti]|uniref:arsenate reductase family protein n=1 Tax=Empedobacter sedimenti TaxID=3042610 RepID=UPI0024A72117|nr:ArsC/Spx/MgsR family protein [Empedobacter sedimenti]